MLRIIVLELYITGVLETAATKKNITNIVIPFCFFLWEWFFFFVTKLSPFHHGFNRMLREGRFTRLT